MPTYIEYELEDGVTILVQADEDQRTGPVKASRGKDSNVIVKAGKKFSDALESVRIQALLMYDKLEDLRADEVEVKFGLNTTGEVGNFAVGKVGVEANYEVTLKWSNQDEKSV